jgi:hypothetical protein
LAPQHQSVSSLLAAQEVPLFDEAWTTSASGAAPVVTRVATGEFANELVPPQVGAVPVMRTPGSQA